MVNGTKETPIQFVVEVKFSALSWPMPKPKIKKTMERPSSAKPATHRPMTLPPRKATCNVFPSLRVTRASLETRTLA